MKWLKRLFLRRRLYDDLSEEIREHLEEKIEELVASGMPRKEAAAAARREFGNTILIEEEVAQSGDGRLLKTPSWIFVTRCACCTRIPVSPPWPC
jgi:hypothetical protein